MKQKHIIFNLILFIAFITNPYIVMANTLDGKNHFSVCGAIVAYGIIAMISLALIVGYSIAIKNKDIWMFLLFIAVFIVNVGYLALAISKTLEEALLANRISYLGSVLLPLCMLMTISIMCKITLPRGLVGFLICISVVVFIIAASQGYLDWYYKEVTLVQIEGGVKLHKVYGPLHNIYPIYLLLYFISMIIVTVYSYVKKIIKSYKYILVILSVVFINIFIWGFEQVVDEPFEFLSISYIISEMALLMLYMRVQKKKSNKRITPENKYGLENNQKTINTIEDILGDSKWTSELTARELEVFKEILHNKKRKDIAEQLCVSENTVKKHTSHIFSKLEVTNRTELFEKLNIK